MKLEMFLSEESLKELANELLAVKPTATLWDIFVYALAEKANMEPYKLWILSDLPVIEKLAEGYDIDYISDYLNLPIQEVEATCKTWGLFLLRETLDFSPRLVYNRGMEFEIFRAKLEPVQAMLPERRVLKGVYENVRKYYDIIEFLDEEE